MENVSSLMSVKENTETIVEILIILDSETDLVLSVGHF
jgi:hypothetical protein